MKTLESKKTTTKNSTQVIVLSLCVGQSSFTNRWGGQLGQTTNTLGPVDGRRGRC